MAVSDPSRSLQRNTFVLCFDGTGNKFSGTDADSNILKLYRMLDRTDATMYTFYQPGIGTYVASHSMQTTSMIGRIRSAYLKAKDSAIGSSFAEHVMGGYQFLMRYYNSEDDLYFFGFSRGAYTARFLAEMLDHIGLLCAGNEELIKFAWKTYAKWACRKSDSTEKAKRKEKELYEFMRGFRQTFSRPVRRIRFLGLFDTVNSVPRFESAWMARTKFPYTARPSAKVIRHAVSIDERRAKFRQDLISASHQHQDESSLPQKIHRYGSDSNWTTQESAQEKDGNSGRGNMPTTGTDSTAAVNPRTNIEVASSPERSSADQNHHDPGYLSVPSARGRPNISSESLAHSVHTPNSEDIGSTTGTSDQPQQGKGRPRLRRRWSEEKHDQDIQEVWFAGVHGDVGGGWKKIHEHEKMLSHVPLMWMVHEAERAGLKFDLSKIADRSYIPGELDQFGARIEDYSSSEQFLRHLEGCYSHGSIHDCLEIGHGLTWANVIFWKMMEYLPFRRMDLHEGRWRAIRWPLPMGETRDIPPDAQIHNTVIKRMEARPDYRPGNLIVGGGGRGVRRAPEKYKLGEWSPHACEGDSVRGTFVRKDWQDETSKKYSSTGLNEKVLESGEERSGATAGNNRP
ncbi:hypothetical protein ABEF93_002193 [Exophiala dermatitidis]